MAILNQPSGNRNFYDLIRFFRPTGSTTVVWAQDMTTGTILNLLRWGNEIYLPAYDGLRLGIGVCNGNGNWRAYPVYVEARNLWDGGPAQPEDCDTDHMWEVKPWMQMVMDKLMNPNANLGRPLIITAAGQGLTIGEATFGTTMYRGQIRVYERLQHGGDYQTSRRTNAGSGTRGGVMKGGGFESFGEEEVMRGGPQFLGPKGVTRGGHAGIGAGAEEYTAHYETGVSYQHNAQPVVFLRVEYREDLQPMLNTAWGFDWGWDQPLPHIPNWWDTPWTLRKSSPTAPEIPVIGPHRPRS